jgi:hypothetical protein
MVGVLINRSRARVLSVEAQRTATSDSRVQPHTTRSRSAGVALAMCHSFEMLSQQPSRPAGRPSSADASRD